MELDHQYLQAGDVTLHLVCAGEGPLVVLCHGYPGLWYSWRHQIPVLAAAGYRVVAMDMRGYGRSSRPTGREHYSLDRTSADVLAVFDHFDAEQAVLFGHDFGANLAWYVAVHHPQRLRGVGSLCVPYDMALAGGADIRPSQLYAQVASEHFFHMHYYQREGVPEESCRGREREFLAKLFWALCADGDLLGWEAFPPDAHYVDVLAAPPSEPPWPWLSREDFEFYLAEYLCAGPELAFAGGINAYRAMDLNWELGREQAHAPVEVPALYVGGAEDPVVKLGDPGEFAHMRRLVKDLRCEKLLPGAGHFIQQESPEALNRLLLDFLENL